MGQSVEFWSSVELGGFLRGLVRELRAQGLDVRHRFEVSESDYRFAHGAVARGALRWRSYVSYPRHLRHELRADAAPNIVVVCTNTFYAPAIALRAARRRGLRVVNWVFDLFPDVLVESATIRSGGFWDRRLAQLARTTFRDAAANVFLGERLKAFAMNRFAEIPRAWVIPVGADGEAFRTDVPQPRSLAGPVRILYCGNLGRMHDTATIVQLLGQSPPAGWTMEFRGHGAGFRRLAQLVGANHPESPVSFGPSVPDAEWPQVLKAADVALVTMKRGAEGLVMPSKTYSAMVAGQAILAICPRASDLADTVLRHDAGWVVEPGDVAALREILVGFGERPLETLQKRRNAFAAGHQAYDQRALARPWSDLLASLGPAANPRS